jgi:hypothetical protein
VTELVTQQPLDRIPILLFVALFVLLTLACYEIGFRVGQRRRQDGDRGEDGDGATGIIVGSILGLMAFILAITMGMAGDRFDNRRGLVLEEANALGTLWLRSGYLPGSASSDMRDLIAEYIPLRIAPSGQAQLAANVERSEELQADMWAIAEDVAREAGSDVNALFIESLNETIDLHTSRVVAGLYARVPPTILWLLIGGVALSLGMVGFNAGLTGRRSPVTAILLIVALGAVVTLVVDLDRPGDGFIRTSQQPLIDLQERIEASQ